MNRTLKAWLLFFVLLFGGMWMIREVTGPTCLNKTSVSSHLRQGVKVSSHSRCLTRRDQSVWEVLAMVVTIFGSGWGAIQYFQAPERKRLAKLEAEEKAKNTEWDQSLREAQRQRKIDRDRQKVSYKSSRKSAIEGVISQEELAKMNYAEAILNGDTELAEKIRKARIK
ncbi:hypothetical protein [Photobacterium rosenbergii]|uniref:Uncharacterized protein n=1 Tax=Photobacterium rosenbergii TaxID=294936 RepID=A0ABU3ZIB4_9GAMM|nr:hypothetical protein [Photobacterium rosenbergii]MDV5169718.1 hypothetical protein [Photobacterium rosenbergii]